MRWGRRARLQHCPVSAEAAASSAAPRGPGRLRGSGSSGGGRSCSRDSASTRQGPLSGRGVGLGQVTGGGASLRGSPGGRRASVVRRDGLGGKDRQDRQTAEELGLRAVREGRAAWGAPRGRWYDPRDRDGQARPAEAKGRKSL